MNREELGEVIEEISFREIIHHIKNISNTYHLIVEILGTTLLFFQVWEKPAVVFVQLLFLQLFISRHKVSFQNFICYLLLLLTGRCNVDVYQLWQEDTVSICYFIFSLYLGSSKAWFQHLIILSNFLFNVGNFMLCVSLLPWMPQDTSIN